MGAFPPGFRSLWAPSSGPSPTQPSCDPRVTPAAAVTREHKLISASGGRSPEASVGRAMSSGGGAGGGPVSCFSSLRRGLPPLARGPCLHCPSQMCLQSSPLTLCLPSPPPSFPDSDHVPPCQEGPGATLGNPDSPPTSRPLTHSHQPRALATQGFRLTGVGHQDMGIPRDFPTPTRCPRCPPPARRTPCF